MNRLPNLDPAPGHPLADFRAEDDSALSGAWRFREEWATRLAGRLNSQTFRLAGYPIPLNVRVSCGVPSGGRLPRSLRRVAITYDRRLSADDTFEIALNPLLENSFQVAAALGEQFIYIVNGLENGRDRSFKRIAAAVDLHGPAQRMIPGPAFKRVVEQTIDGIGPYPHAAFAQGATNTDQGVNSVVVTSGPRPQKARLIKAECSVCGLTMRLANKWLHQNGPLVCPASACEGHTKPLLIS